MTEDYKKGILDYISGNITPESKGVNSFRDNEKTTNDLTNKLSALGITQNLLSIFSLPNENSSSYLLYSQYQKDSKTLFLLIFAREAEPPRTI